MLITNNYLFLFTSSSYWCLKKIYVIALHCKIEEYFFPSWFPNAYFSILCTPLSQYG